MEHSICLFSCCLLQRLPSFSGTTFSSFSGTNLHLHYHFYTHLWLPLCGSTPSLFLLHVSSFSTSPLITSVSIPSFLSHPPPAHLPSSIFNLFFFCQMYDSWFQRSDMNILRGPNIHFLEGNKEGDGERAVIGEEWGEANGCGSEG